MKVDVNDLEGMREQKSECETNGEDGLFVVLK
jgi:hypothetical protein